MLLRLRWFIALLSVSVAAAKAPPEWLRPLLAEDVSELGSGRNAVRLLDGSTVRHLPDNRVKRVERGAIRILKDGGRREASCAYVFNADTERVTAARAWVVTPDGKKAEEFSLREFFDVAQHVGSISWTQQRVLSYSATSTITIGSTFAWEFEVESQTGISDIVWSIPDDLPLLLSVLEVSPSPGGRLVSHATDEGLPTAVPGATPGTLRWERRRAPALVVADYPDRFLPASRMLSVRNIPASGPAIQTWADMASLSADVIEPRIPGGPDVKAKAEALVAGKTNRWERIRALSEFVQKEITYLIVTLDKDYLAGYRPHPASEVLQNRFGDCKDKAALFVSMLRAIGEDGRVVLVFSGDPKAVRPDWPSASFNHAIAAVPADDAVPAGWPVVDAGALGRLVLFDATDPATPLGYLSASDQGGFGLVVSPKATSLVALPVADASLNHRATKVRASLDSQGTLSAAVEEISTGYIGIMLHSLRENLRNERYTPLLEERLRETVSLLQDLHWKDGWEPAAFRWRLEFDFKAPRYARRTGGSLLLVSPIFLSPKVRLTPWKTKREGVVWSAPSTQRREVRLALPEGAVIEEVPDDWSEATTTSVGKITYRKEVNEVVCLAELTQKGGFLDQATYEAMRLFLQKMQDAERRPLLIRSAAAAPAMK
jgi:hypothetical protein